MAQTPEHTGMLTPVAVSPLPVTPTGTVGNSEIPRIPHISLPLVSSPVVGCTPRIIPTVSLTKSIPLDTDQGRLQSVTGSPIKLPPLSTLPGQSSPFDKQLTGNSYLLFKKYLLDNELEPLGWTSYPLSENYWRLGCIPDGNCFFHSIAKCLSELYQVSYTTYGKVSESRLREFENILCPPEDRFSHYNAFPLGIIQPARGTAPEYSIVNEPLYTNIMDSFRKKFVVKFRYDLANSILTDKTMRERIINYFPARIERYYHGSLDQAINRVVQDLATNLLNNEFIEPDYMLLIADHANIDIYLLRDLESGNNPLYGGTMLHSAVWGPNNLRFPQDKYFTHPNRNAIVIVASGDNHYEIVTKINKINLPTGQIIKISAVMNNIEPIIQELYKILAPARNISQIKS